MTDFIYNHLGELLSVFIAGFGGWFFGRKKQRAEAESLEIENDIKTISLYKEILEDLPKRYEDKYKEVAALFEAKEKLLRDEITMLSSRVKMLKQENVELRKRIAELEKLIKNN